MGITIFPGTGVAVGVNVGSGVKVIVGVKVAGTLVCVEGTGVASTPQANSVSAIMVIPNLVVFMDSPFLLSDVLIDNRSFWKERANGLRYPRWGGRRNAVRLEK
jgi:hypothetical protein